MEEEVDKSGQQYENCRYLNPIIGRFILARFVSVQAIFQIFGFQLGTLYEVHIGTLNKLNDILIVCQNGS